MKNLLSSEYFPFGVQYYKAPSPHKNEWDNDLKNISELGFNIVKFCIQWRWNHPKEDKVSYNDIDRLMELSSQYNLKVILSFISDAAPAWIYNKYPDASMITLSGKKIAPQTAPNRQIGGLGYCMNNDNVFKHYLQFLKVTVERFKDHPALEIWEIANQSELTSSLAELREYANDPDKIGDMLCYCNFCRVKFKRWITEKYGSIERLNESWNRNYFSFDDIEIPLTRNTYNDIIDWRMFFVHSLGKKIEKSFEIAGSIVNSKKPLMCNHLSLQEFPVTSSANDPWNMAKHGDLHGSILTGDNGMIDLLRSSAKNKPVLSSELSLQSGYTLDMPEGIDEITVKKVIFGALAGNLKGLIFRQYRPETAGREAPAWGITSLDGKPTERLELISKVGEVVRNNAEFFLSAKPEKAEIAMLYNPENQVFSWASSGTESLATDSILGIHKSLYERNYNVDFVHPMEFDQGILAGYKVLIIAFPYVINKKMAKIISEWVNEGGLLISEAFTAGWDIDNGRHATVVPGSGLDKVYQSTQGTVRPVDNNVGTEITSFEKNIFGENLKLKGLYVQEELIPSEEETNKQVKKVQKFEKIDHVNTKTETEEEAGTRSNGRFKNLETAVTIGEYGKGKAIAIGTYIGIVCHKEDHLQNANYLAKLIENHSEVTAPIIDFGKVVRVNVLQSENNQSMIIVRNLMGEALESAVNLKIKVADELSEQFSEEKVRVVRTEEGVKIPFYLEPYQIKVYFG